MPAPAPAGLVVTGGLPPLSGSLTPPLAPVGPIQLPAATLGAAATAEAVSGTMSMAGSLQAAFISSVQRARSPARCITPPRSLSPRVPILSVCLEQQRRQQQQQQKQQWPWQPLQPDQINRHVCGP